MGLFAKEERAEEYLERTSWGENVFYNEEKDVDKASEQIMRVLVYVTPQKEKFLDEETLAALLGTTKVIDYQGKDGYKYTADEDIIIKKGKFDGFEKIGERYLSDFDDYPYDYILGLYRVTDMQLDILISNYEKMHNAKLEIDYLDIDKKDKTYNKNIITKRDLLEDMFRDKHNNGDEISISSDNIYKK